MRFSRTVSSGEVESGYERREDVVYEDWMYGKGSTARHSLFCLYPDGTCKYVWKDETDGSSGAVQGKFSLSYTDFVKMLESSTDLPNLDNYVMWVRRS